MRRLREARHLTQRDLAAAAGVASGHISRIESGKRTATLHIIRDVAARLGVSADYLETGELIGGAEARDLRLADAELALQFNDDVTDPEQTFIALLKEAAATGDRNAELRARIGLATIAARRAAWPEVIRRLERVVGTDRIRPATHPAVYENLAHAYVEVNQAGDAIRLFRKCLRRLRGHDNDIIYIRLAMRLSAALCDIGDLKEAQRVINVALTRHRPGSDPYTRVRLYWSQARLALHQGDAETARLYAGRAITLLESREDTMNLARAQLLAADIAFSDGELGEAEAWLTQAEDAAIALDHQDKAILRAGQARIAVRRGEPARALALAEEAARLAADDPPILGRAKWALAEAYAALGERAEAETAFARAECLVAPRFTQELRAARSVALDAVDRTREARAMRRKTTA